MENSWVSLLPFLVVIPISVLSKQVQPGLFAGLILGSYLIQPDLFGGIKTLISYLINNLVKPNNIRIIIFLYVFAGLINLTKIMGGMKGFVNLVGRRVKTKRSAMLLIWLSTIGTFNNPNFRIVTVAPIMKLLKRRLPISLQKIGFMIEVTANPVVALVPIATAFVGYMVSLIGTSLQQVGINESPYSVFIKSIPFNFFSLSIIGIGLYYSFFREMSSETQENLVDTNEAQHEEEALKKCIENYQKETPSKPINLILPLCVILIMTLFLSWRDGRSQTNNFFETFLKADSLGVMLEALFVTLLLSLLFFLLQGISVAKIVTHFVEGGNELVSVILMLALVWALSAVSEDLGFSTYIASNLVGWIPKSFIAPIVFILGSSIAYFIGSSWGTWGLLMPLAVTLAQETGSSIILVIGAVFASGTFGAFASPLSDNSITLCTILDLPVMEYARSKLIPSLIAAIITTVLFTVVSILI
ncbi:Na+/H+ antiporter NhaC family protein [Desulfosporosinus meridiei]|uniref:Na+/H+ antiporter n=1 Tax=Desulfosporosinus meridiei (strain ATCC BAA-275 / DSM 13257 / KCTC 12902 / NCIMB 13706 / S10) TaxID=768704 RepID=J7IRS0_DESMD|nr:Na+/H+ antiporter NhaC family protein [Desulfosporosinus meridiei]AFQ42884.1 Na+/H+ antiporter [Desulfosporosinus meridiei DSM 13257]